MITTTTPPDGGEPEPDDPIPTPDPTPNLADYLNSTVGHPESTYRYDRYVDDKFLEIFAHEDRNPALSRIVTEALAQNDNGGQWAPITSWRDWWARAKRAENQSQGGN